MDSLTRIATAENIRLLTEAKRYAKGRLLDIGCGDKPYQNIFSDVSEYVGLDKKPIAEVKGSAHLLPFTKDSFDTVLCTQVLMSLEYPQVAVEEMFRVLKKGCCAIVTTKTNGAQRSKVEKWHFTIFGLKWLFESAGFEIIYIKPRLGLISAYQEKLNFYLKEEVLKTLDNVFPIGHITVARK